MRERFTEHRFSPASEKIVMQANDICQRYAAQGYDLSLRQLYYQFIAVDAFPNTEESYKKLGDIVSNARLAGLLDWDMISDRGRVTTKNNHWDSPADILDAVAKQFMYDTWTDQVNYVEVMVEKQALQGVLEPVCRSLDISFTANKGYSSSSALYETGKRLQEKFVGNGTIEDYDFSDVLFYQSKDQFFDYGNNEDYLPSGSQIMEWRDSEKMRDWAKADDLLAQEARAYMKPHPDGGKAVHIVYLGDHDPSGIDMTRDVRERLELFSRCPVQVHRVALNMNQVQQYAPPPNPAKMTDSRAADYVKRFGPVSWELDALNPETLAATVTQIVASLRDPAAYEAAQQKQKAAREALKTMAENYRKETIA